MNSIGIKNITLGPDSPLTIISGPCALESYDLCMTIGQAMRDACQKLGMGFIFKASFDKANRSSIDSKRGLGLDAGLGLLAKIGQALDVPVTTDIHETGQVIAASQAVDLLQIPAFLCRQTDLLVAAGQTGKPVNVKKGQFMSPGEMAGPIRKLLQAGQQDNHTPGRIMLTERGTFFGYNRLVNDFVGLGEMMKMDWPVCFDVTHSTQRPGGLGDKSGGQPEYAPLLAKAAVVAKVQALFIETHPNPKEALSDAATMLPLETTLHLLPQLATLYQAVRQ